MSFISQRKVEESYKQYVFQLSFCENSISSHLVLLQIHFEEASIFLNASKFSHASIEIKRIQSTNKPVFSAIQSVFIYIFWWLLGIFHIFVFLDSSIRTHSLYTFYKLKLKITVKVLYTLTKILEDINNGTKIENSHRWKP